MQWQAWTWAAPRGKAVYLGTYPQAQAIRVACNHAKATGSLPYICRYGSALHKRLRRFA